MSTPHLALTSIMPGCWASATTENQPEIVASHFFALDLGHTDSKSEHQAMDHFGSEILFQSDTYHGGNGSLLDSLTPEVGEAGIEMYLVNAGHVRRLPERKTDV